MIYILLKLYNRKILIKCISFFNSKTKNYGAKIIIYADYLNFSSICQVIKLLFVIFYFFTYYIIFFSST